MVWSQQQHIRTTANAMTAYKAEYRQNHVAFTALIAIGEYANLLCYRPHGRSAKSFVSQVFAQIEQETSK
jgi:hypothetical protein